MYSVKEVADILDITPRAVAMKCRDAKLPKKGRSYVIPEEYLQKWRGENHSLLEKEIPKEEREVKEKEVKEEKEGLVYEEFTIEQYNKLQEVIQEYPNLIREIQQYKEEIVYLRNELHSRTKQMDKLINTIDGSIKSLHQANFLTAKDKGYE